MDRLNNVLLASDFSQASENALEHAAVIAAKNDATLHVLHVHVLLQDVYGEEKFPERERYQEALDRFGSQGLEKIQPRFQVPIKKATRRDVSAASAIVEYTEQESIDLVIMGSHGHAPFRRAFLGSVARDVIRHSPVSVLVVGQGEHHALKKDKYDIIVAPVDFSKSSEHSFREAAALCQTHHAKLVALHVVSDTPHPAYYVSAGSKLLEVFPHLEKHAREELENWVKNAHLEHEQVDTLIAEGRVHKKINEIAANYGADLIVIGTEGMSGIDRFLLGSVTNKVLRTAPCPLLAVKSGEGINV